VKFVDRGIDGIRIVAFGDEVLSGGSCVSIRRSPKVLRVVLVQLVAFLVFRSIRAEVRRPFFVDLLSGPPSS